METPNGFVAESLDSDDAVPQLHPRFAAARSVQLQQYQQHMQVQQQQLQQRLQQCELRPSPDGESPPPFPLSHDTVVGPITASLEDLTTPERV